MLHRVGWVGATAGPRKLCAAVRESTRAPLNPPPPPSSPRYRNGSRRRTGAGAEMTRETRKSPSMVPTKTDRAVKLPTPTVVRELPRRSGKRHATSRRTSRSYCHTREALLRCSTPQPAGRLTRRAMAPDRLPRTAPRTKPKKNRNAKRKNGSLEKTAGSNGSLCAATKNDPWVVFASRKHLKEMAAGPICAFHQKHAAGNAGPFRYERAFEALMDI